MSLRSVATYSLFRSMVKQLTLREDEFKQGEIIGNIRCFIRSTGLPYYEDPAFVKRPVQPLAGAALVTQLDFREQFLVVRLFRCENLPAANLDAGTSDPVVKVKWDGMTNSSTSKQGTLRPVWNQNLYFPIRLLDPQERTSLSYIQRCLPVDLLSKGNIVFECWDQDETSSDFLGGCEMHLSELLKSGKIAIRCLAEGLRQGDSEAARMPDGRPVAFQYQGEDAEPIDASAAAMPKAAPQPYEIQYQTHVYSGNGIELTGATIATSTTAKPLIFFEVFCIPPLPPELELPAPLPVKEEQDLWKQWSRRWERDFNRWQRIYQEWFPTAPKERRFLCTADHPQTRRLHPLPSFVTPIAVPEQISDEGELLHWITNMTFLISTKQFRSGLLPRWLSPNYFLITRKGGVNDHAVLLCSCLLGLDYDAYVCKGTINSGKDEHCWVMTRHEDGWVVFWELTNKKRYHLPARWGYQAVEPKPATQDPNSFPATTLNAGPDADKGSYYYNGDFLKAWYARAATECGVAFSEERDFEDVGVYGDDVVPDVRLEDIELDLEGFGQSKDAHRRKGGTRNKLDMDKLRAWMEAQIDVIPIAPKKNLLDPDATLCYLPYSSIEVVFNNGQLWGNLQNHHPAVIYYDITDPYLWRPFLTEKPNPIDSFIFIAPSTRDKACDVLNAEIQADVAENVRVLRSRRGLETQVDHGEDKSERLEKYLDLLEFRLRLDPDYDPGPPPHHQAWSAWGAYESVENMQDYSTTWYSHLQKDPADVTLYGWESRNGEGQGNADAAASDAALKFEDFKADPAGYQSGSAAYVPQQLTLVERNNSPPINLSSASPAVNQPVSQFQTAAVHGAPPDDSSVSESEAPMSTRRSMLNSQANSKQDAQRPQSATASNLPTPGSNVFDRYSEDPLGAAYVQTPLQDDSHKTFALPAQFSYNAESSRSGSRHLLDSPDWETYPVLSFADVVNPDAASYTRSNTSSETSSDSDGASVLKYCKRKNIRLASDVVGITAPTLQDAGTSSATMREDAGGRRASDNTFPQVSKTPDVACVTKKEKADMTKRGAQFLASPVPPLRPAVQTITTAGGSCSLPHRSLVCRDPSDPVWESIDDIFDTHGKSFQVSPQHEMILDNYEDFEQQQEQARKRTTTPVEPLPPPSHHVMTPPHQPPVSSSFSVQPRTNNQVPTSVPSPSSTVQAAAKQPLPTPAADDKNIDYYKVFQKPAKVLDKPETPTLDIQKLGFTIRDTPRGAVCATPSSSRRSSESRAAESSVILTDKEKVVDTGERTPSVTPSQQFDEAIPQPAYPAPESTLPATAIAPVVNPALGKVLPPQVFRRPIVRSQYPADQLAKWNYYYRMEGLYYEWQKMRFPVRPSHTFCGFPLHFATTDSSDIRSFLLSSRRFRRIIEVPVDGVTYVIRCKVYPLMGGVVSCWLFIGCEIHWAGKQERQTRMKRVRKKKPKDKR